MTVKVGHRMGRGIGQGGVRLQTLPYVRGPGPVVSRRPEPAPAGVLLPCAGRSDIWESVEPTVIEQAQSGCSECPAQEWCEREARHAVADGLDIFGVWHGEVYPRVNGKVGGTG